MNLSKLTWADRLIVLSAAVLFVASFLEWFSADISAAGGLIGGTPAVDGWEVSGALFWVATPVVLALAMVVVTAARKLRQTPLPDLSIGWGQILFFAGLLAGALVLLKFLVSEEASDFTVRGVLVTVDVSRSYGIYIAVLAGLGLALGGYLAWREEKKGGGGQSSPTPF